MSDKLPKFDRPPVVETVLSAQFSRLSKFKTAHAGVFCESFLGKDWCGIDEQSRIEDKFERFGDDRKWGPPGGTFRLSAEMEPQRTQIIGKDVTRMVQVQDSRFIYNWRKDETGKYPSYSITREEFDKLYARFKEFVNSHDLGKVEENQWEVTYINHVVKGELWDSPQDWNSVFPWLNPPSALLEKESVHCFWDFPLHDTLGRLHAKLYTGRVTPEGPDALILDMTARGPVSTSPGMSIEEGFDIGHEAIVRVFVDMTSKRAHEYWQRRQ